MRSSIPCVFRALVAALAWFAASSCADGRNQEAADAQEEKACFTIVSYNVLYGFNKGKSLERGARWIKAQNPDVVGLQELTGFDGAKLKAAATRWGHGYSEILETKDFPIGITSKTPIETIEKRKKGMKRGYLHCKTAGIHFFVIHLNPVGYKRRQREASVICKKAGPLIERKKNVVILGDFNCHSPHDKGYLEGKKKLLAILRSPGEKRSANLDNGFFDLSVMRAFLDTGLEDVCFQLLKDDPEFKGTHPTTLRKKTRPLPNEDLLKRIDFVLMDKASSRLCSGAEIPRNEITNSISDHYPVIVHMKR